MVTDQSRQTDLLLHLPDFEIMAAQLRVVDIVVAIALSAFNNRLNLLDKSAASTRNGLAGIF